MSLRINSIEYKDSGKKIKYNFDYDKSISKYFTKNDDFFSTYDIDVSSVPENIAMIPFLTNIVPISWFAGFDIYIDDIDNNFYQSIENIKAEFVKNYPKLKNKSSKIHFKNLIDNKQNGNKKAMLFSGGVDAYATYFRHFEETPDLVTVHGADVDLSDFKQWNGILELNNNEPLIQNNKRFTIKSNIRTFYSNEVNLLLDGVGWWSHVQHGLSLNGLIAPLSFLRGYNTVYIASSYTDNIDVLWGSTPEIDNKIKWANTQVVHDGYELKRQEKVDLIIDETAKLNSPIKIRVCYSLFNNSTNCSKCEKCYRTIIGIILAGGNPSDYGLKVTENVYDDILRFLNDGFKTEGVSYFWWEIYEKIKEIDGFFVFENSELEKAKMDEVKKLIDLNIKKGINEKTGSDKFKKKIVNHFPKLFKYYLKFRVYLFNIKQNKT